MSAREPSFDAERHPIERLAEEFLERQRRGEHPALSEYTALSRAGRGNPRPLPRLGGDGTGQAGSRGADR
jgi:hypothetical protein